MSDSLRLIAQLGAILAASSMWIERDDSQTDHPALSRTVLACCKSLIVHQAPKSLSQPHTPNSFPSSSESGEGHFGINVFTSRSTSLGFTKLKVSPASVESSCKDARVLCTLHILPAMTPWSSPVIISAPSSVESSGFINSGNQKYGLDGRSKTWSRKCCTHRLGLRSASLRRKTWCWLRIIFFSSREDCSERSSAIMLDNFSRQGRWSHPVPEQPEYKIRL